jgi:tRNA-dihydrouridine synthase B
MLSSDRQLWKTEKSSNRNRFDDEPGLRWVQIAGSDPEQMATAAMDIASRGAHIIDINMGCPAKKVCRKAAGSALLRDEALVARIVGRVVNAVSVPVTLKIRLGWSYDELNAVRIARIAENEGIAALTVHGRTRECRFSGNVNYPLIAEVKSRVSIPVIANGDIGSIRKAKEVIGSTGADALMIGRAALGQPWLPARIDASLQGRLPECLSLERKTALMQEHILLLADFYGETKGHRIARKHVGWFLQEHFVESQFLRRQFNVLESSEDQLEFFNNSCPSQLQVA